MAPAGGALAASDRGVLRALAAGPLPTRALLAALGVDARTLSRSKRRLLGAALIRTEGDGPGSRWALTDAGRAAPTAEPDPPAPRGRASGGATHGLVEALAALTAEVARLADAMERGHHGAP